MNKQTLREDAVDGAVMDGASKETSEKVPISFLIFSKSPYSASKTLHCACYALTTAVAP